MNGIGDAAFAFINGFVEMVGRILLPALLAGSLFGVWGLWLSGGLTWFISGLFAVIRYRGKLGRKDEGIVNKLHNSLRKETA